ncbi:MAG TPA: TetR/AcrR family transcriptional regulator [Acidimicrobiia bacterium]
MGERGARTRQAIVDAARGLFEAKGFHATSVEDIAEAAGTSRAALYQYFASKEQLFIEQIRGAAADLLRVIRRLGPIGPTAEGYDNLHWWVGEWAWVQDKYKPLYLQSAVVNSPAASRRPMMAEYIVSCVSSLSPRLEGAIGDDDIDVDGVATVLLALLFRMNDYRQKGITRTLGDDEVLDSFATFVQLTLFPSTPPHALAAHAAAAAPGPKGARAGRRRPAAKPSGSDGSAQTPKTVQRILDAAAETFAVRGFHATSVQDVLEAAGAGRGTFYKYFDDKTQLLVTLAEQCMARLSDLAAQFDGAIGKDDDGYALRAWLEECLALHRRYRGVFAAVLQEEAHNPALNELRLKSGAAILLAFDDALAAIDREYPFDVRVGSLVLLALLERGPDYAFGTAYDLADTRIVEVLTTLIERGLLGRTPARTPRRAAP